MAKLADLKSSGYRLPMWRGLMIAAATVLAGQTALADPRPAVVELFTSQGCNSCPPADALLGELAQRKDVLALAYHVDYWDSLGWRDVFSSAEATRRQTLYAPQLGLDSIYTPQMVIDGRSDVVGSYKSSVLALLKDKREGVPLAAHREANEFIVEIGPHPDAKRTAVMLVAYSRSAETKVPRGENAGKTLREFNIVRGFWHIGDWAGEAAKLHFDAAKLPEGTTDVALLLQEAGPGAIIGATSLPAN